MLSQYLTAIHCAGSARSQGYAGARWPKNVGPDGRGSPSPIGPFLIWQQPQPILLAELVRRATAAAAGPAGVLDRYADVVLESAAFMADFAVRTDRGYQLGPPLVPAQESYALQRASLTNPTFELAWWRWGLRVAQQWRALHDVLSDWDSTWGWDYPAVAMTATRLGEPETALRALLLDAAKNTYLSNGHNRQTGALPIYLPGNGGLLSAVALMAGGPEPGFPVDGWRVRQEGLLTWP